jgi:hypothetical protein
MILHLLRVWQVGLGLFLSFYFIHVLSNISSYVSHLFHPQFHMLFRLHLITIGLFHLTTSSTPILPSVPHRIVIHVSYISNS